MAHFRCLVRGEGFSGILDGRDGPIGFYVNRPVEAIDAEQARRAVLVAFQAELAERGWADKGGRLFVEEIDEIDASELPSIGQGFVVFPEADADAESGNVELQVPFLLVRQAWFSVCSNTLAEPWMMTRTAMNTFRNAVCYDASGRACTIIDVVLLRDLTLRDRMVPWRQIPVRLVLQRGPDLSLDDVRDRLVSVIQGDSEIADFVKMPVDAAIAGLNRARTPWEMIQATKAILGAA